MISRIFNNYLDILFLDAKDNDFIYYLNDDDLYLTNNIDSTLNKISERVKNKFGKLPNFRSSNKEAKEKYKNSIKYFEELIKDENEANEINSFKFIITLYKYKVFLIDKKLSRKNFKNTSELRNMVASYVKKRYPNLKNIDNKYFYSEKDIDLKIIKRLNDYIEVNNEIQKQINEKDKSNIYFRGHSNYIYELIPSIYRENYINNEHKMFRDTLIRNPEEFSHAKSTFEKLTIMQHYGLPTRLLDVTKNPLVALFFACENMNNEHNPSEVIVFNPEEKDIKYYDSDTVCILSNI